MIADAQKILSDYGIPFNKCGDWNYADPTIMGSILATLLHEIIASDMGNNFFDEYGSTWLRSTQEAQSHYIQKTNSALQEPYDMTVVREMVLDSIGKKHLSIYIQRWMAKDTRIYDQLKQKFDGQIELLAKKNESVVVSPVQSNIGDLSNSGYAESKVVDFFKEQLQDEAAKQEEDTQSVGTVENKENSIPADSESIIVTNGISSAWKNLPVPEGDDRHDEFFNQTMTSRDGLIVIGARARGKKHKHEGTNCDDWFEIASTGQWTIIAVSDGAGSHFLSRVGAKVACLVASSYLKDKLSFVSLKERESVSDWQKDLQRNAEWVFHGDDIETIQIALIDAMRKSHDAIVDEANARNVEVRDLSATLLLSVHASVECSGKKYDFILSSQIGDGMIAAIYQGNGRAALLVEPDTGTFSGQTDFITSKSKLLPASIRTRTNPFFSPMLALMVMTDGVSDDYFPHGLGMQRLYCDMVINGILSSVNDKSAIFEEKDVVASSAAVISGKDYIYEVEREIGGLSRKVEVRDTQKLSELLGQSLEELVKEPRQLQKYSLQSLRAEDSAERLEDWLDSYQVRGSFDDRTLVVMFKSKWGVYE